MSSELINQYVNHYQGERYPGLPRLDYLRRYLDGLVSILEGYLMTFSTILITIGISFSMFDFLSGGTALNDPNVFKIWAIVQTVAIDAQFVNMWYRLKVSLREGKRWQAGGYLVLGVTLAFVTFGASVIPALQKALGLGFDAAIVQAGLNPTVMIWARSFVAILLAIIGAFQRTVIVFDKTGQIKNTEQKPNTATPAKQPGFIARKYAQITALLAEKPNTSQAPIEQVREQEKPVVLEEVTQENTVVTELSVKPKPKDTQPLSETLQNTRNEAVERDTEPIKLAKKSTKLNVRKTTKRTNNVRGSGEESIKQILSDKPSVKNAEICRVTGLSASYVSTTRKQLEGSA